MRVGTPIAAGLGLSHLRNTNVIRTHQAPNAVSRWVEIHLRTTCLALVAIALLSTAPAFGQYSAVIAACHWDSQHHCAGVAPQEGAFARCIRTNFLELTESCQDALVTVAAVSEACGKDIQQQCPAIQPGDGRILLCVKAHYAALSEPCKDAMGHAAERSLHAR
jgi:hypothetical protein